MKAISLWQPWASLIANGHKQFETRSWATRYRGTIAIHAAKKWNTELAGLVWKSPFYEALSGVSRTNLSRNIDEVLPRGCVVAIAHLQDCIEITADNQPGAREQAFGDFTPGQFMWKFGNIYKLPEPVPYRGQQGLFHVELNRKNLTGLQERKSEKWTE